MTLMWQEIHEQPEVLGRCVQKNAILIQKIAAEVKKREITSIVIAARGTSDHAAVYGKYLFEILTGLPVSLAAPSVITMYGRTLKYGKTLVIGVSQSGRAGDVGEVIDAASREGALTVAVTNAEDSPLAQKAGIHLFCNAGPEKSVAATKTFTAELLLLGRLAAQIAGNTAVLRQFDSIPERMKAAFETAPQIKQVVQRYRFMKECFVLARGVNYPVALEAALKIQETAYVRAKAFATSDFHHGPMAMLERELPVIIFAPSGPSQIDVLELAAKAKEARSDILMISDSKEVCAMGDCSICTPAAGSDFISPFVNAAVAQMFACELSLLKGLDPDTPRMLNKVTITK